MATSHSGRVRNSLSEAPHRGEVASEALTIPLGVTEQHFPQQQDWRPVPDPTTLTTAQLRRELDNATRELRRELESVRLLLATRVDNEVRRNDDRHATLVEDITRRFSEVRRLVDLVRERGTEDIGRLSEVNEERFKAIAQQFAERDVRSDQDKKSSKDALDAALLAQKESVSQQNDANTAKADKTEASFTKQIDQVGDLIRALDKSWQDRFTELKERIDRGEGSVKGSADTVTDQRSETQLAYSAQANKVNQLLAVIAVVAVLVAMATTAVLAFKK